MNGGVQGCGGAQEAVAEFEETNPGVYDGPLCYVTYYFIDDADQVILLARGMQML